MRYDLFLGTLVAATLAACNPADPGGDLAAPEPELEATQSDSLAGEDQVEEAPASARFALGTHYRRLSPVQPTRSGPGQVEVAVVYDYGCAPCSELEAYLDRWLMTRPARVSFVRIPAAPDPAASLHARAYFAAAALGRREELHAAAFREVAGGNPLDSDAALAALFARLGVEEATFRAAFDSYAVHAEARRADELARRYRATAVPTLIVNGKYVTTVAMAGGYESLIALIDFLAASERREG